MTLYIKKIETVLRQSYKRCKNKTKIAVKDISSLQIDSTQERSQNNSKVCRKLEIILLMVLLKPACGSYSSLKCLEMFHITIPTGANMPILSLHQFTVNADWTLGYQRKIPFSPTSHTMQHHAIQVRWILKLNYSKISLINWWTHLWKQVGLKSIGFLWLLWKKVVQKTVALSG